MTRHAWPCLAISSSHVAKDRPQRSLPVGSGQKYKRCCLAAEESARLQTASRETDRYAAGPDDDGHNCASDEVAPFDYAALELVGYSRGFVDDEATIGTDDRLRVTECRVPDIPRDLVDALAREGLHELDRAFGDPDAAAPIQVDAIYLRTPDDGVVVEIGNRAHLLLATTTEEPRRLHRVCGALEAAADRGVDVPPAGPRPGAAAGSPAFGLEAAVKAHRTQRGVCALCGGELTSAGASRHLDACAPRHDAAAGPRQALIHLRVTAPGVRGYWLDLEAPADAKLLALDAFLRHTWVECCGHLSLFEIGGQEYASSPVDDPWGGMFRRRVRQRSLDVAIGRALAGAGGRFSYAYDFGSPTRLRLDVRGGRDGRIGRAAGQLLARNTPLIWPCADCGAPAAWLCSDCIQSSENPFVCDAHARRHACGEDMLRLVVNSPRRGVCGYG